MRWVMLDNLRVQENEPPLHWPAIRSLVTGKRKDHRPIDIEPLEDEPGTWLITNGRHRVMAAVILGKSHIRCQVHRANV